MVTLSKKEENRVFEVIDRVLKQLFGEEATRVMYQHLEHHYSWSQRTFSERIEAFAKGMEEFLSSGAYIVENKILNTIYSSNNALHEAEVEGSEEQDFSSQLIRAMQKA